MNVMCIVALALSLLIFVGSAIIAWLASSRKRVKESADALSASDANEKRRKLTPIRVCLIGFFVAAVVLLFPIFYYGGKSIEQTCISILCLSVLILFGALIVSLLMGRLDSGEVDKFTKKPRRFITPFYLFLAGFFVSAIVLMLPLYYYGEKLAEISDLKILKTVLFSLNNTMRLFILDGDYEMVVFPLKMLSKEFGLIYSIYAGMLFVVAPILTASFVLSFFKDVSALLKFALRRKANIYVMSELNAKSVTLAENIVSDKNIKGRKVIVFTDVTASEDEGRFELLERAKRIGAICFKKDVADLSLKRRCKNVTRKIFLIGIDESENVKQALVMINRFRGVKNYDDFSTQFYVFANNLESEELLNAINSGNMKVRRVRQTCNLALDTLQKYSIFENAVEVKGVKRICVAIVGMGGYGTELLKAMCWLGQMVGYRLELHAFDGDVGFVDKLRSTVPELVKYNDQTTGDEPYYKIRFHAGVDVNSPEFLDELSKIKNITSTFVMLGDDELNVETAMRIRMQYGRDNEKFGRVIPPIYAVVYSTIKSQTFSSNGGLRSVEGDDYGITFIGSMRYRYSLNIVEEADLEAEGLKRHLFWTSYLNTYEERLALFEKYEYYRRSSISEALHIRFCKTLDKVKSGDSENNRLIAKCERRRWKAFMRSEGFVGTNAPKKDLIAKTHPQLKWGEVSVDGTEDEQE